MTWRETLIDLKQDLVEVRANRERRVEEAEAGLKKEREDLSLMAQNLGVEQLLIEMNSTLLDGNGEIETIVGWEADEEDDDNLGSRISIIDAVPDDDEDADVITSVLSWDEGGVLEIVVDLGLSDEGIYLQINEIEIRPEREALEQGLIVAFKDELGI
tara:strand:+ start:2724 stop:3197 length:474 start_codon:yes stop_codon:yes gene_type:complete